MSVKPGICQKQTKTKGVGGAKSTTINMPTKLEYGRQKSADGLSAQAYANCPADQPGL